MEGLAERFGVTLQTIRRDLSELADAGKLDRVHGGAVLRAGVANIGYAERRLMNADAKAAIGRACAATIPDNSSLFLNIGTTTEAVARALLHHRNLTVVTNNMNVANILAESEGCDVIVAGGVLRRSDGGLVGDLTTEAGQRAGLLRYNQSIPYGSLVLAEGRGYRDALELPDIPPRPDDAD